MAETRTVNLEIKDNVKSLKTQYKEAIQEVQRLADTYGATSTEAANAAKNAAKLKDKIEESKSLTDAFNPDAKFNSLSNSIGGVLNGFQAYEGAMGLIGVESEELQKTMLKVQSAMALSQGIQGALEAKDAFVNLGSVVKNAFTGMTSASKLFAVAGIGLLITGITLLITNFEKVTAFIQPIIDKVKELSDFIGISDFAGEERAKNERERYDNERKNIERNNELRQRAFDNEQKGIQRTIDLYKAQGKDVTELTRLKLKNSLDVKKALLEEILLLEKNAKFYAERGTNLQKAVSNAIIDNADLVKQEILDIENEIKIFDINAKKEAADRNKTAVDNAKQSAQDARNLKRQIQDEEIKAIEDVNQREQTQLIITAQRRIEDLSLTEKDKKANAKLILEIQNNLNKDLEKSDEAFYATQRKAQEDANNNKIRLQREFDNIIEALAEQNFQNTLTEEQREIQAVNDKYFELQTLAAGNAEQLAIIEKAKADELGAIEKKAGEKSVEEAKAVAAQKAAIQQQGLDTALQGVQLIKGLFEKSKGVQKAAVIAESAIGIAKMIIANKLANAGALATPQAIASSGAAAAPVIALNNISTGIGIAANIAATAKALKSLGGGSAPSAPADGGGGGGGGGASTTPQFNTIGSSGVNQLAQLQQQPVQAYVVSGDVTSAQSLDRNRIQNATL